MPDRNLQNIVTDVANYLDTKRKESAVLFNDFLRTRGMRGLPDVVKQKMFNEYLYVSSTTEVFRKHFSDTADTLIKDFNLREGSFVVDIGSNDGVFLKPLQEKGISVCGVEPAKNLSYLAEQNGDPTINGYFEDEDTIRIISKI